MSVNNEAPRTEGVTSGGDSNAAQDSKPEVREFLAAVETDDVLAIHYAYAKLGPVDQNNLMHLLPPLPPRVSPQPGPGTERTNDSGARAEEDPHSLLSPASLGALARAYALSTGVLAGRHQNNQATGLLALVPAEQRDTFLALVREIARGEDTGSRIDTAIELSKLRSRHMALDLWESEKHAPDLARLEARSRRLDDFLAELASETRYDIAELLPHRGNVTLCAPFKTGKTTMRDNAARCVADGDPFLGVHPVTPGVVGLWDLEMEDGQAREWMRDAGIRNRERVHVLTLKGVPFSFRSDAFRAWTVEWLRTREVGFWIIDPGHLAAMGFLTGRRDPNDEITEFTAVLDQIKNEAGVRNTLVALHTGLSGEHARGGARWADWPDAIWTLKKDDGTGIRTLSAVGRDVELKPTSLRYDRETRHLTVDGFVPAGGVTVGPSDSRQLVLWLKNNPGNHPPKVVLQEKLGWGFKRFRAAIHDAEFDGSITVVEGARNARKVWLTEERQAHLSAQEEAVAPHQEEIDVSYSASYSEQLAE